MALLLELNPSFWLGQVIPADRKIPVKLLFGQEDEKLYQGGNDEVKPTVIERGIRRLAGFVANR